MDIGDGDQLRARDAAFQVIGMEPADAPAPMIPIRSVFIRFVLSAMVEDMRAFIPCQYYPVIILPPTTS